MLNFRNKNKIKKTIKFDDRKMKLKNFISKYDISKLKKKNLFLFR